MVVSDADHIWHTPGNKQKQEKKGAAQPSILQSTGEHRLWQPERWLKILEGGTKMNGLDQLIVALWFLPVALFIVIPLCVSCVWGIISLLTSPFQKAASHQTPPAAAESPAG